MPLDHPYPELDELFAAIGEAGQLSWAFDTSDLCQLRDGHQVAYR